LRLDDRKVAYVIAPVNAQATYGTACGRATAYRQTLHDAHVARQPKSAGALDFTVNVEHRRTLHEHDVAR